MRKRRDLFLRDPDLPLDTAKGETVSVAFLFFLFQELIIFLDLMFHLFKLGFGALLLFLDLLQFLFRIGDIGLCLQQVFLAAVIILYKQADLIFFQLFLQPQVLSRLFRLLCQRAYLFFQLCQDVADAEQVLALRFQIFLCCGLSLFKLYNSRRLIKKFPALLWFTAEDLINLTLTNNRVSLFSDTSVKKKLLYIFQPAYRTIK